MDAARPRLAACRAREPLEENEGIAACRALAREHGITIVAGSVSERVGERERVANTSALIDREGAIVARYRKIHMFDVDVGGVAYRESEFEHAGSTRPSSPSSMLGGTPVPVGLTVCYDLRFPELYRTLALAGARLISIPSAFTAATGEPHWEVLVRARAIEDQLFVVAANQVGSAPPHYESWGHSMICDPWGRVLASVEEGEGVAVAELDLDQLESIRERLPALANRRPDAYRGPQRPRSGASA